MATYVYETIPDNPDEKPRRFEVQQKMTDEPLSHDPESGLPVKRVITGGGVGHRDSRDEHPLDALPGVEVVKVFPGRGQAESSEPI